MTLRIWSGLLTVLTVSLVVWNDYESARLVPRLIEAAFMVAAVAGWWKVARRRESRLVESSRETLDRLNLVLRTSGIGTWTWDVLKNRVTTDDLNLSHFGLSDPRQIQSVEDFAALVHPEDRAAVHRHISEAMAGGELYHSEFRTVTPDGSVRTLNSAGKVFRDGDGRPVEFYGTCWDITRHKQAEEEIRRAKEAAEAALARVRKLEGMLPMCSYCKKVRDEKNAWQHVDVYLSQRSEAKVSHGVCPGCYHEILEPQLDALEKSPGP